MTVSRVQDAAGGINAGSLTVTLAGTPATGNLLIGWANSDALVSIGGSGWNAGPSVIDGNGTYLWWKISGPSEPAGVTFTPSVSDFICAGLAEYSGTTGTPLDVSGSSTHSGAAVNATTAVGVTTTADHDLGFSVACLHAGPLAAPTVPSWTNSWSELHEAGAVGPSYVVYTFAADNTDLGMAGSVSTGASWSGTAWPDAQQLLITFAAAASVSIPVDAALAETSAATAALGRAAPLAAAMAETSTAAAVIARSVPADATAAQASALAAGIGRTAPADAVLAEASALAAAIGRTAPLATSLTQPSVLAAAVVDRITRRPVAGTTARPFTGTTTRP